MKDENKYPDIIIRKGVGTFSTRNIEFESAFEIIHYPQNTIIETIIAEKYVSIHLLVLKDELWELKGLTEDKKQVQAKNLIRRSINGNQLTLVTFKDLSFGQDEISNFSYAEFPLVGIYGQNFNLENNDWEISSYGQKDELESIKEKSENWNLQLEGIILKIKKTGATKDQLLSKANSITSLLSLALGNDIIFNRQLYYKDDKLLFEDWRRKVDYHFGAERCIPDFELSNFIKLTIGNFEKWNDKKKKLFFSTVNYINSSSKGYLEDRLLGISIAWESLAQSWSIKKKNAFNKDLDPFKNFLKKSISDFELPIQYDKNFIRDRILNSLEWERLTESLLNFSDQFNLDRDKLGLDFKSLITIRNDIAHTGLFRKDFPKDFLIDLLHSHILGLRVVFLKELGYDKLIESQKDKSRVFIKIDELLKTESNP